MRLSRLSPVGVFLLAAALCVPAWGANSALPATTNTNYEYRQPASSVVPGTVNYIEGQVAIGSRPVNSQAVGSAALAAGQSLSTKSGKAEVLLTPGVFLRIGDKSAVRMISPTLTRTEVSLAKGQAMVEVDQIHRANNLLITQDGVTTRLLKTGLYDFDANQHQVRVFKGQAQVREGDHQVKVGGGHQVTLTPAAKMKVQKFDKSAYEGDLYRFSQLRSDYLAEANAKAAPLYIYNGWYAPTWFGPGWYWDSWVGGYTFIPGEGILFSPFGWDFYSPLALYPGPVFLRGHDRDHDAAIVGMDDRDHDAQPRPQTQTVAPRVANQSRPAATAHVPVMRAPQPAVRVSPPAMRAPHPTPIPPRFR